MNILDLPNEMLIKIGSLLSVADLKALSETCTRFNDVVMPTCVSQNGVLWLNRIIEKTSAFGKKEKVREFIDIETLETSERRYTAIGINLPVFLPNNELYTLYNRINAVLVRQTHIRDLFVNDGSNLVVRTLYETFPRLFETIEGLSITMVFTTITVDGVVEDNWHLPNLRWIEWIEPKERGSTFDSRMSQINLHAPKLERLTMFMPKDTNRISNLYRNIPVPQTVDHLQEVKCVLGVRVMELFASKPFPALKRLHLMKEEYRDSDISWDRIARHTPNLETLILQRNPNQYADLAPLSAFLLCCTKLKELHLDGLDLYDVVGLTFLWQGIETLHVHKCSVQLEENETVVFHLPNVRKLCVNFCLGQHGELVLLLPKVETLSLSNMNPTLNVLEMPMLKTLHLRIQLRREMTFLVRPLPNLRTLVLDSPGLYLGVTEQLYRMLLGPNVRLTSLMIVCRSGCIMDGLIHQINALQPALQTVKLIGYGCMSRIRKTSFHSLINLPQLKNLLITNVHVTATITEPFPLLDVLRQIRIRSMFVPVRSRSIAITPAQRRLGELVEQSVLHHTVVCINASEVPNYEMLSLAPAICYDVVARMLLNDLEE